MSGPDQHDASVSQGEEAKSSTEQAAGEAPLTLLPPVTASPRARWSRWWVLLGMLCALIPMGYRFRQPISEYASRLFSGGSDPAPAGAQGARGIPVVAATAKKADLPIYLTGLGTVTAFNSVTIRTRVDGQLDKVAFVEGQMVAEGDLLAEIDPRPFDAALQQLVANKARDEANLENARKDLVRQQDLFKKGIVAASDLDTAQATAEADAAIVKADDASIVNAKLQLTYCRITSPISGRIGLRLVDQGNMVHASDANGLAVITHVEPISVLFSLPQDNLPQVQEAMAAGLFEKALPVDAFSRDLKKRLASGTLATVDNQIDPTTGTVKFKAVFPNRDHALFPNQFVNARLLVDTKKGTVLVPAVAIQRSPTSVFVYVVKVDDPSTASSGPAVSPAAGSRPNGPSAANSGPTGTVEVRTITPGPTEGETASIEDGVKPGEVVVTDGVDKLVPGSKVTIRRQGGAATRPATQSGPAASAPSSGTRPARGERP